RDSLRCRAIPDGSKRGAGFFHARHPADREAAAYARLVRLDLELVEATAAPISAAVRGLHGRVPAAAPADDARAALLPDWPHGGGNAEHAGLLAAAGAMEVGADAAIPAAARALIRDVVRDLFRRLRRLCGCECPTLYRGIRMVRGSLPGAGEYQHHIDSGL